MKEFREYENYNGLDLLFTYFYLDDLSEINDVQDHLLSDIIYVQVSPRVIIQKNQRKEIEEKYKSHWIKRIKQIVKNNYLAYSETHINYDNTMIHESLRSDGRIKFFKFQVHIRKIDLDRGGFYKPGETPPEIDIE